MIILFSHPNMPLDPFNPSTTSVFFLKHVVLNATNSSDQQSISLPEWFLRSPLSQNLFSNLLLLRPLRRLLRLHRHLQRRPHRQRRRCQHQTNKHGNKDDQQKDRKHLVITPRMRPSSTTPTTEEMATEIATTTATGMKEEEEEEEEEELWGMERMYQDKTCFTMQRR